MYKRLLVPLDGSRHAERILPTVERFAKGLNADIHLLSAIAEDVFHAVGNPLEGRYTKQQQASVITIAQDYLRDIAGKIDLPDAQVRRTVTVNYAPEAIIEQAHREPDTLIAMSTHGRSGVGRFLLGSVADKVLHATTAPLLLYRPPQSDDALTTPEMSTVVVPLDGSELAERVLPHVTELAPALQLKVILTRVTEFHQYYLADAYYYPPYPVALMEEMEKDAEKYLHEKVAQLQKQGLKDVSCRHFTGYAPDQIIDLVKNTPGGFAAISTHGRSGIKRWVLGSVADKIVRHATAPVLVIRA